MWDDLGSIPRLGRSLEKGKAIHSSILAGEFHGLYRPWGRKESDTTERLSLSAGVVVVFPRLILTCQAFYFKQQEELFHTLPAFPQL